MSYLKRLCESLQTETHIKKIEETLTNIGKLFNYIQYDDDEINDDATISTALVRIIEYTQESTIELVLVASRTLKVILRCKINGLLKQLIMYGL